ncbi:hypothetical protein [Mahella sp.]|uniref:protein kinase domain-containing protein n=1 Tax=Mahella sp. TaxID=2798721 RepID=UPI0025BFBF99|nr:hypothetical protein [Mahella sp.]
MEDIHLGSDICGRWHNRCYEVLKLLGRGGTGSVFLARRVDDGKKVALKISCEGEDLIYEYHSLTDMACLSMVPEVIELDEWHGYTFLVLEYIEGYDLSHYIRAGKCSYAVAVHLGCILAFLMSKVWQKGYCLTDIKPENVMVDTANRRIISIDWSSLTEAGATVKEFTPTYDIASWGVGQRMADQRYMVFAISMVMMVLIMGKSYSPVNVSIDEVLADIRRAKCPIGVKNILIAGLKGGYDTLQQFYNAMNALDMYDQPSGNDRIDEIINIALAAAALFAFLSIANWLTLI